MKNIVIYVEKPWDLLVEPAEIIRPLVTENTEV